MTTKFWSPWAKACAVLTGMLMALIFLFASQDSSADGQAMMLPVDASPLVVSTRSGERVFQIEIADKPAERAAGLMFRKNMPDDRGMLFVFEQTQALAFWMKNTPMPLDLVFIGPDGRVKAILPGEPYSEAAISPGEPALYVLELKSGTAVKLGISEGDVIRHPRIIETLAPGLPPTGN